MSGSGKAKTKGRPAGDDKLSGDAGQQNKVPNSEARAANVNDKGKSVSTRKDDKLDLILQNLGEINKKVDKNSDMIREQKQKQQELEQNQQRKAEQAASAVPDYEYSEHDYEYYDEHEPYQDDLYEERYDYEDENLWDSENERNAKRRKLNDFSAEAFGIRVNKRNTAKQNENEVKQAETAESSSSSAAVDKDTVTAQSSSDKTEPESTKTKSKFHVALDKYKKDQKYMGEKVDEAIAEMANGFFEEGLDREEFKGLIKAIPMPENCQNLTEVRVNELVWHLLKQPTRNMDEKFQIIQTALAKIGINLAHVIQMVNDPHRLKHIDDILNKSTESMAMLGHAYHLLCLRRRDLHKPDVDWRYANLCSANIKHTSLLYGDDIQGEIKKIGDDNKYSNTIRGGYYYAPRPRYNPYNQPRGRARGRYTGPRGARSRVRSRGRGLRFGQNQRFVRRNHSQASTSQGEVSFRSESNMLLNDSDRNSETALKFEAGKLKHHRRQWSEITSDTEILQTISGCRIEFEEEVPPIQTNMKRNFQFNMQESKIIDNEIEELLAKKVIEETSHEEGEFISNIFLRKKKNGRYRMILNLKEFNVHVEYHHFKMETLETALKLVTRDCYMASIDIKDAYYCVPVHEDYRKYLKFNWNSKLFQFTCAPNGLACVPRKYTKMMKPVYSVLRKQGHNITGYIDDNLLLADTQEELSDTVKTTTNMLEKLGFTINKEKSVFTPSKQITYLGFVIDSENMTVTLAAEKIETIAQECKLLKAKEIDKIRNVAKVIGMIVATFPGVDQGPLHYRNLEWERTAALQCNKGNYDATMNLTDNMREELSWWIDNLQGQTRQIGRPNADIIITTDASTHGWGACLGEEKTGGRWKENEKHFHINYLEILAILLGLKSFEDCTRNKQVQIRSDNTTAVSYINHMGGKQVELDQLAKIIWSWCLNRDMWITAAHIPGVENVTADFESRNFNERTEWSLKRELFEKIVANFGQVDIDLFASRLNAKCARYASWQRDPQAEFVDAFTRSWHETNNYLFPPFSIIGRCLQKLRQDHARAIMVVPLWTTQGWFTNLFSLLVDTPILIPQQEDVVILPGSEKLHPLRKRLQLIAVKISGVRSENTTFQEKLPTSSWQPGDMAHTNNIVSISKDGTDFVYKGRLILCDRRLLRY